MPADASSAGGSATISTASPSPAELQRSVEQMTNLVHELRETEKTARRRALLGTLLLIVVILAFALVTYNKVRDNFAREKLQQAAAQRAQQLLPQIQPQVQLMMGELLPYYTEMGQQRLKTLSPKLDARVRDQANQLGHELEQKINAQVEASFGRITSVAMAKLAAEFPAVSKDGGARATERLKAAMAEETSKLSAHTRDLYKVQADRIGASLSRFPVPDVSKADMDSLQRQLLHELLMFADYELTAGGKPAAGSAAVQGATK
jgi:hypothetical protein